MHIFGFRHTSAILGATLLAAVSGVALAQNATEQPGEEIIVYAPYLVHTSEKPSGDPLRPILTVTVARHVSYADLDLSKSADADSFEKRIRDTASDVCRELDKRLRKPGYVLVSDRRKCAVTAANDALATARKIIAASRGS